MFCGLASFIQHHVCEVHAAVARIRISVLLWLSHISLYVSTTLSSSSLSAKGSLCHFHLLAVVSSAAMSGCFWRINSSVVTGICIRYREFSEKCLTSLRVFGALDCIQVLINSASHKLKLQKLVQIQGTPPHLHRDILVAVSQSRAF